MSLFYVRRTSVYMYVVALIVWVEATLALTCKW